MAWVIKSSRPTRSQRPTFSSEAPLSEGSIARERKQHHQPGPSMQIREPLEDILHSITFRPCSPYPTGPLIKQTALIPTSEVPRLSQPQHDEKSDAKFSSADPA